MYEKFYGLSCKPFQLNPDPLFYFDSAQHRRAMAYVEYGLHQSEGFVVVTGEVGAGKTTVVRNLIASLDAGHIVAANIVTTQLEADDLLRLVAAAFGVQSRDLAKADLLMALEAVLASHARDGKRCLLIVDEAQNLNTRAVEELRMLSNFQLGTHALLQSFLVGQPEFRRMLQSPELSQLRQRVIAACHIGPMTAQETRRYIEHRLHLAGWTDRPLITDGAFAAVHEVSGGLPRRINLTFDRALLAGFLEERQVVTEENIREVAAEIAGETEVPASLRRGAGDDVVAGAPWGTELARLESELRRMQESISRVEHGNQATLALFRRFLEESRPGEPVSVPPAIVRKGKADA
jgi:general secretion pathway protein A